MILKIMKRTMLFIVLGVILISGFAIPAYAAGGDLEPDHLGGILGLILIIAAAGVGMASMGLIANHIFYRRTVISYILLKRKPGLSLLFGIIITFVFLGAIALLQALGIPQLAVLVLLIYILGLAIFAIGTVVRLAAHIAEPRQIEDEVPGTTAFIKGGMMLTAMNIILILGNIFFFAVLLAGVGSVLLGYFAGMGNSLAGKPDKPPDGSETQLSE